MMLDFYILHAIAFDLDGNRDTVHDEWFYDSADLPEDVDIHNWIMHRYPKAICVKAYKRIEPAEPNRLEQFHATMDNGRSESV